MSDQFTRFDNGDLIAELLGHVQYMRRKKDRTALAANIRHNSLERVCRFWIKSHKGFIQN
ncbi:hypothetical protein D3C81_2331120 [compost metagenome]